MRKGGSALILAGIFFGTTETAQALDPKGISGMAVGSARLICGKKHWSCNWNSHRPWVGSGALGEARKAAGYLSKYVAKSFDDPNFMSGLHCYDLAQGFTPKVEYILGTSPNALNEVMVLGQKKPRANYGVR